jgi:hypothetical protein
VTFRTAPSTDPRRRPGPAGSTGTAPSHHPTSAGPERGRRPRRASRSVGRPPPDAAGERRGSPRSTANDTGGPIVRTRRAAIALSRSNPGAADPAERERAARTSVGTRTRSSSPSVSCSHSARRLLRWFARDRRGRIRPFGSTRTSDRKTSSSSGVRGIVPTRLRWIRRRSPSTVIPLNSGGASIRFAVAQVEPVAHREEAAVEQHRPADRARPAERELERDVRSPRVPDDDRPVQTRRSDHGGRVVRSPVEAVAGGGLGGPPCPRWS